MVEIRNRNESYNRGDIDLCTTWKTPCWIDVEGYSQIEIRFELILSKNNEYRAIT